MKERKHSKSKTFSFVTVSNEVPEENLALLIDAIIYGESWTKQEIVSGRNSLPPNKAMITKVHVFVLEKDKYCLTSCSNILTFIVNIDCDTH